MYHRIKLETESPPRSFCYKMLLTSVKDENMETRNPKHSNKPFSTYMHNHQYMILQHKKHNTFTPVTINSTQRNDY